MPDWARYIIVRSYVLLETREGIGYDRYPVYFEERLMRLEDQTYYKRIYPYTCCPQGHLWSDVSYPLRLCTCAVCGKTYQLVRNRTDGTWTFEEIATETRKEETDAHLDE